MINAFLTFVFVVVCAVIVTAPLFLSWLVVTGH